MKATITTKGDTVEVNVPLVTYQRGDIFICYCPVLDLMTYSKDEDKLQDYFDQTLDHFLETNQKHLRQTLESLGWNMKKPLKSPSNINIPNVDNSKLIHRQVNIPSLALA